MNKYKVDTKRYKAFFELIDYFYRHLDMLDKDKLFKPANYSEEEEKGYKFLVHATGKKYQDLEWICLDTNETIEFKKTYELVEGMHIMPYRIQEEDVIIDLFKNYKSDVFPDIDDISGNIHKDKYANIQLVLLGKDTPYTGPGTIQIVDDIDALRKQIKSHWYYPPVFKKDYDALSEIEKEHLAKMDAMYEDYINGSCTLEAMIESLIVVLEDFKKKFKKG